MASTYEEAPAGTARSAAPPGVPPVWRRLGWLDYVVLILFVLVLAFVFHRISTELHYRWNWRTVLDFVVFYDSRTQGWRTNILLQGLCATIRLVLWASVLALAIGVALGVCRASGMPLLRMAAGLY